MNDNNNNQLNQSKRDSTCDSSSTTIKEEMTDNDTSTDDIKELRASQTMVTIKNCPTPEIPETVLKTSQSSPSALQTNTSASNKSGNRKTVSIVTKKTTETVANGICNCECKAKDFEKTTLSPDEVKYEIVKILNDVDQITNRMSLTDSASSRSSDSPYLTYSSIRAKTLLSKYSFLYNNNHMTAAAKNQPLNIIKETMIGAQDNAMKDKTIDMKQQQQENKTVTSATSTTDTKINTNDLMMMSKDEIDDIDNIDDECGNDDIDIPLMLINLAQSNPITSNVIPAISVLPPTPDPKNQHNNQFNLTKDLEITKVNSISIKTESSFDSVEDEEEEPPYVKLKTSLRRFGTMSSLERLPSEDTDEKTLNSSDDDSIEDMKVSTTLIKDLSGESSSQSYRTWTSRAGSFLEESKAFIDKYLGRTDGYSDYVYLKNDPKDPNNDFDEYETIEGEATSGEEVWGTPTSGGENDEMHMFNNGDDGNQMVKKKTK